MDFLLPRRRAPRRRAVAPVLLCSLALLAAPAPAETLAPRVTWTDHGRDSQDSMPLGNGDIGLNVWTESDGSVLFYIGKTDAWAEATAEEMSSQRDQLVKLARVRVRLEPDPFAKADDLCQTLDAATASLTISGAGTSLRLWVDANQPVIHGEVTSPNPVRLSVSLDPWRTEPKDSLSADVVVPDENEQIVWYHRNAGRDVLPQLVDRTFGGSLSGPGLERDGLRTMQSVTAGENSSFTIAVLTRKSGSIDEWRAELEKIADRADRTPVAEAWRGHTAWWDNFWQRSYIRVSGSDDAQKVTDGYAWQRYLTACAGRGDFPIKFNGSIFVTDNPGRMQRDRVTKEEYAAPMNADERHWGARYWFQNTRPMYWPRLAAGDYDLMMPFFRMFRDMLPLNESRVREFYGHGGAFFRETAPFWGDLVKVTPDDEGRYTRHYYLPILETAAMMLAYYEHTGDNEFARDYLVPVAAAGLQFYDEHFPRGSDGKLRLEPVNSLEQFWKVADPTPDLAALRYLLPRLVELPDDLVAEETKKRWRRLLGEVPTLPVGMKNGRQVILPYTGEQTAQAHNTEVPEMYAVYPFPLYGVGRPDLPLALDTFAERDIKRTKCWHQDPVWAACLGLADDARRDVVANFTNGDPRLKFPAFWEKGHDYAPDQDNGGNGELALQWMLLQAVDNKILLLPAWPRDWNADFKLHAPQRTVVEGRVENGKIVRLKVTPPERRRDIVMPDRLLP
jgi:alpha-L-fucosidase 2